MENMSREEGGGVGGEWVRGSVDMRWDLFWGK